MSHSSKRARQQQQDLNVGNRFHQRGDVRRSAAAYAHYVERYPSDKVGHFNLAVALEANHESGRAMYSYGRALELDPWYPEALNNLGILFHKQNRLEEAKLCYARALAARPDYEDAEYNFATAESDCRNPQNAIFHLSRLLKRNPKRADAWNNLGNSLLALNAPTDALQAFRLAAALDPKLPDVAWNAASAELALGQLPQGWHGFERRHKPLRHSAVPRWDGSEIRNKSLLIHAEQGFGDTIQFARYCGQVKHVSSARISLECHPDLISLLCTVPGIDECVPFGAASPDVDYQIPLLSLPLVFESSLENIPAAPYLQADRSLVQKWARQLDAPAGHLRVGLVWSGNPSHRNDRNRSIAPELLDVFAGCDDIAFYCLQQKPQSTGLTQLQSPLFAGVFDELTFPDTAAILSNLDLLISVDTAIAHLAGALGLPVWTLLPFASDWRWMLNRSDSPWYPTMRLFRQPQLNDWPSVLQRVKSELLALPTVRR